MFTVIWRYEVHSGREAEFEVFYGSGGPWSELFRRSSYYTDTALLRDVSHPHTYVTMDRWVSEAGYREFLRAERAEYARIDAQAEAMTAREEMLGTFVS